MNIPLEDDDDEADADDCDSDDDERGFSFLLSESKLPDVIDERCCPPLPLAPLVEPLFVELPEPRLPDDDDRGNADLCPTDCGNCGDSSLCTPIGAAGS